MEDGNKKWIFLVLLLILCVFSTSLFFQDLNEAQSLPLLHTFLVWKPNDSEEHNNIQLLSKAFQWLNSGLFGEQQIIQQEPDRTTISPNLSSCHTAMATETLAVYCCPPKNVANQPFTDFQFPHPSTPLRARQPAHLLDEKYIEKYTKALNIMKSLPFDDPRSFKRQADMHCLFCIGSYNQKYTETGLNIHRSWLFFPWHRMMLYFHERILAKLIEDDTFALPFWQWDAPEGMMLPDYCTNEPFFDSNRDPQHHPPTIVNVNYNFEEPTENNEELISKNLAFMYNQMVSGAKKTELFMGCPRKIGAKGYCNGPGTVELAPHNALHSWVGNQFNPAHEDMGVFYSAARDPCFYAHHSNIDRLWDVWRNFTGYKLEIVDPDWLNSYFYFHDENAHLIRIKIRDVLNITQLGYMYEQVDLPWLNARPKPCVDPKQARIKLNISLNDEKSLSGRMLDRDIRIKVQRPKRCRSEKEEEVLVVYGIDVRKDAYVKFDVLVNAVVDVGPESREFAGAFVNVRRGVTIVKEEGDEVMSRKIDLKLGISELLTDLEANEDESIWVTLIPRGGTGVNTTVGGIRIEYMV